MLFISFPYCTSLTSSTKPNGISNSKYYLILNLRWIFKYHLNCGFYVDNLYQTNGVS